MSNSTELPVGWTPASVLMNATGDAMDNIFDIIINWPWSAESSDGAEAAASYRAKGFSVPEPKTKTYTISWYGVVVKKVAAGVELDRSFDLSFRLDANYALYQKFTAWKKLVADVNTSGVANTESALGRVQVIAPGAEYNSLSWTPPSKASDTGNMLSEAMKNTTMLKWTFEDVQAVNVGTPKFNNTGSGKTIDYKVDFTFGDVDYPFYTHAPGVAHPHKQS